MGTNEIRDWNITPTHKVGIKLLTEMQMVNIFPNYNNLLNRIENHREQIRGLNMEKMRHYQYNLMYDNVFSIFGKRGTGKTSVVFTLQKWIEENQSHPYDIVLPIIIPEVIPSDCSSLGWILAIVKEQIEKLEEEWERLEQSSELEQNGFWRNCKYSGDYGSLRRLSKKVDELVELYFAVKYNPANELSYSIAVGNSAKQAQNYYSFAKKITQFWDEWVKTICKLYEAQKPFNGEEDNKEIVPLIYFIFDDVDLAPEKVSELMSIIIKYLSHPNIIVISTADEEMFTEVIENNLDEKIGRLPKEWRNFLRKPQEDYREHISQQEKSTDDLISETACLYLGKVMPTSTRYYLKLFDTSEEKQWFRLNDECRLGEGIAVLIDDLLKYTSGKKSPLQNFMRIDKMEVNFYLSFFGDTSRQIGNAFLGIQEFIEALKKHIDNYNQKKEVIDEDEYLEALYSSCWHFLHIALNANHNLAETLNNIEEFVDEMFLLEHNGWKLYINYSYLEEFLKQLVTKEDKKAVLKTVLQLYSLFIFLENILLILEMCTKEGITGRKTVHGITGMIGFICDNAFNGRQKIRRDLNANQFFLHYKTLLNKLWYTANCEQNNARTDIEYLHDFVDVPYNNIDIHVFSSLFNRSRDWLNEMSGMLSIVYGNLYLIRKKEIEESMIYKNEGILCGYQKNVESLFLRDLHNCIDAFDFRSMAIKEIESLKFEFLQIKQDNNEMEVYSDTIYDTLKQEIIADITLRVRHENNEQSMTDDELRSTIMDKYEDESAVPMTRIVLQVEEDCQKRSLSWVMNRLPVELMENLVERCNSLQSRDEVLSVFKIVCHAIVRWDYADHDIFFSNVAAFLDEIYETGNNEVVFKDLALIADRISQYFDADVIQQSGEWSIIGTTLYSEIKNSLRNIHTKLLENTRNNLSENSERAIKTKAEKIGEFFDISVDLENKDGFKDAVATAVMIQVAKYFQRIYLFYTVKEKYDQGYSYSSSRIEKMYIRKNEKRTRNRMEKYAYYYEMFLKMKELLMLENTDEEARMIKSFIERSAFVHRERYINKLIQEVENEPISY